MLILTRALALTALLTVFTACADAPRQPASTPQTDTADDADAEPPVQPSAAPQQAAPESKIGLMALLNPLPADARCTVDASGLEARYTLQGDEIPTRVVRSASGDSARSLPSFLEVRASRPIAGGADEVETLYVSFGAEGRVETGTRQYFTTGSPPIRESGRLGAADSANARLLAQQVLERCKPRS